jgi:arylsulfatase A-like enzyme
MILPMQVRNCVLLWLAYFCQSYSSQAQSKPNVIVIVVDDMGWADLGCHGVRMDVKTPSLDSLAMSGVRFSAGYACAPVCVPSRAGLLTGRYPNRFGMESNDDGPLPISESTIGDRMQSIGYVTGLVGKWHVASGAENNADQKKIPANEILWGDGVRITNRNLPGKRGFSQYFCGAMRNYAASFDLDGNDFKDPPVLVNNNGYRIDVQTKAALAFIRKNKDNPFFLYLGYFAPHVPLEAPKAYASSFRDISDSIRLKGLSMIKSVDEGVGRIRLLLQTLDLDRNTLIIFTSDNGAPLKEGMWDGSLNQPYVGEKGMLTDGGIRLPFILSWPDRIKPGSVFKDPVISLDILPTAVAAGGGRMDQSWKLDGRNLLPFLTGVEKGQPHPDLFWRFRSQAAIRSGDWKLIFTAPDKYYLFDMRTPEGEHINLAEKHPSVTKKLAEKLSRHVADLIPSGLPTLALADDKELLDLHLK